MISASLLRQRQRWLVVGGLVLLLLLAFTAGVNAAQGDNGTCLGCHNSKDLSVKLASGEVLPLFVDPSVYNSSIHGVKGLTCVSCHANISGYPHPKVTAGDRRSFQFERYNAVPDLSSQPIQGHTRQQPRPRPGWRQPECGHLHRLSRCT